MRHPGLAALVVFLFGLSACGSWSTSASDDARRLAPGAVGVDPPLRLPRDVRPLAYTLELSVLPKRERFSGRTQIAIMLSKPSDRLWLHGKDLHVTEAQAITAGAATAQTTGRYMQENDDGLASIRFERPLPAGPHLLVLRYDAPFNRQLQGLFRVDSAGQSYAFTQFEALAARQAFPCFDEPGFKTPFELWLTVDAADVAVSNTQVREEEHAGPYKRVHFAVTKPLPTYLVAWAVGPLEIVESAALPASALRAQPIPLRGIATQGRGALLGTALSMLSPVLSALEEYFGIAYPYDKLDVVAVPDFGPGAMENAGLVTFRDALLLLDPQKASESERRRSAFVLAHELAHQWFGDLVTMRFWDDIWLNEAFATWLEYRVLSKLHPEYNSELELVREVQDAMVTDSRVTARKIRQPIESSHDVQSAFDSITYSKGGGVIGMFERYVGAEVFQQGIQAYVREHAFASASTEDLLRALSQAAGRDVTQPFMSFLTQPGVPLIESRLVCEAGHAHVTLHQTRYLPLGSAGGQNARRQTWQAPICMRYEVAGVLRESCTLLTEADGVLPLDGGACPAWVMPNADGAGYYRFALPPAELHRLEQHGLHRLNARERYVLAQSLMAGFVSGTTSGEELLRALPLFAADNERLVAALPLGQLRFLRESLLARHSVNPNARTLLALQFSRFVRGLYEPTAKRLGLFAQKGETGDTQLLRAQVLSGMCDLASDAPSRAALARAGRELLGLSLSGPPTNNSRPAASVEAGPLSNELRDLAVRMAVEEGDESVWQAVYQRLRKTQDAAERGRYLNALAAVRDQRAPEALALALDPALRINEVMIPLRQQLSDYHTRESAYSWFESHFDPLAHRLSPAAMADTPWLAVGHCDEAKAAHIRAFFSPKIEKLPGGPRSLGGALEALSLCDALFKAQTPSLTEFFSKQ